ncbi:hypothetical protein N8985_05725 [Glaciecola sp.]|jgi:hypothetical protein|nr:hypothetical protein [Glaciecola sp.]
MINSQTQHDDTFVQSKSLPLLIAGPMLRHVSANEFTIWLVTSTPCQPDIILYLVAEQDYTPLSLNKDDTYTHSEYQVGTCAFIHLLHIHQTELLAPDTQYAYDVALLPRLAQAQSSAPPEASISVAQRRSDLLYAGQAYFHFRVPNKLLNIPALGWLELDPDTSASNDTTVCSIVTNQGDKITFKAD